MKQQFDGAGFSREPLAPEEAAAVRHMLRKVGETWIEVSPELHQSMTDAATVFQAVAILSKIIRVGGPVLLASAAVGMFLRSQGAI